jgi:hypothetical protein
MAHKYRVIDVLMLRVLSQKCRCQTQVWTPSLDDCQTQLWTPAKRLPNSSLDSGLLLNSSLDDCQTQVWTPDDGLNAI